MRESYSDRPDEGYVFLLRLDHKKGKKEISHSFHRGVQMGMGERGSLAIPRESFLKHILEYRLPIQFIYCFFPDMIR